MKRALLIAAAIMFAAGSASASLWPNGYIGIYQDATHISYYSFCPAQYEQFHAWIWCRPGEDGLQAAEFAVSFPPTAIPQSHLKNPNITVELGSFAAGISVAFGEGWCQTDWVYLYDITMISLGTVSTTIGIIPHPGTLPVPAYQAATCAPGYPIEPLTYLTPLYICPVWDVEESSWGSIKSLF